MRSLLSLSLVLLLATGCSGLRETVDPTVKWSASEFYEEAHAAMNEGNYETAIDYFTKLEARYPYGRYAQQAQIETIYAHYKAQEPAAAIAAADRFIRLHPRHPNVDYAYYMRGLASFEPGSNFLERLFPQDGSKRDPRSARESFRYFEELVKRFPKSEYSEDAVQRMRYLRNGLARHELHVADYYLRRGAYLAAANRARYVVENYQQTPAVPEGLGVMVRAYRVMGLDDLAADARRVLQMNYPDHPVVASLGDAPAEGIEVGTREPVPEDPAEPSFWDRVIPDLW